MEPDPVGPSRAQSDPVGGAVPVRPVADQLDVLEVFLSGRFRFGLRRGRDGRALALKRTREASEPEPDPGTGPVLSADSRRPSRRSRASPGSRCRSC